VSIHAIVKQPQHARMGQKAGN